MGGAGGVPGTEVAALEGWWVPVVTAEAGSSAALVGAVAGRVVASEGGAGAGTGVSVGARAAGELKVLTPLARSTLRGLGAACAPAGWVLMGLWVVDRGFGVDAETPDAPGPPGKAKDASDTEREGGGCWGAVWSPRLSMSSPSLPLPLTADMCVPFLPEPKGLCTLEGACEGVSTRFGS